MKLLSISGSSVPETSENSRKCARRLLKHFLYKARESGLLVPCKIIFLPTKSLFPILHAAAIYLLNMIELY